jgi:hypothetical protein
VTTSPKERKLTICTLVFRGICSPVRMATGMVETSASVMIVTLMGPKMYCAVFMQLPGMVRLSYVCHSIFVTTAIRCTQSHVRHHRRHPSHAPRLASVATATTGHVVFTLTSPIYYPSSIFRVNSYCYLLLLSC